MIFLNLFSSQRLARNFPNSTKWNFLTRFLLLESLDVVVRSVPLLSVVAFFFFFLFFVFDVFPQDVGLDFFVDWADCFRAVLPTCSSQV